MGHRFSPRRLAPWLLLAITSVLISACDAFSSPQNTFNPAGKVAEDQKADFLLVTIIALPIMILVLAACVALPIMFRRKKGDPGLPKQIHGNTTLELTWTVLPAILLAVIAVPTVAGIRELGREPSAEALEVRVTASQFQWRFQYPEIKTAEGAIIESLPEEGADQLTEVLRIPVDREIALRLYSNDVNHSFNVPKLAGKTDVIQNHPNKMWIRGDETGTFEGQCAEFCGLDHSDMRLRIIVMTQADFDAWVVEQGGVETPGGAGPPAEPTAEGGAEGEGDAAAEPTEPAGE